ncbi:endonuclease/exonuclease/phosphatase family protein [Hyphomonas sp. FCG-A18]|uniref:endonuclease/exonuclease/phosphatase family protein n=1 Tax=Hyphomonas sp. FCG-A18 TaxID=3080019 RepID=UPI0038734D4F
MHYRIINWNIERHGPGSWQAASLTGDIAVLKPDLVCLTEAWKQTLSQLDGYSVSAPGAAWSAQDPDERKVLLWSRRSWENVEVAHELDSLGGCLTGLTTIGPDKVRIVGLCIPYQFASPLGQVSKAKQWEMHERFLCKLEPLLSKWSTERPMIVLGDFNRRMPRSWGPKKSYELLERVFERLNIVTTGSLDNVDDRTVDHVAVSSQFNPSQVMGIPAESADGRKRSDHFGVMVDCLYTGFQTRHF